MYIEQIKKKNYKHIRQGFLYGFVVGGSVVAILLDLLVIKKLI